METHHRQQKIIYTNPYPSVILYYADYICQHIFIKPFRLCLDHFLCIFLPVTPEIEKLHRWRLERIKTTGLALCGCFVTFPFAVYGFFIWLLFQWSKQPYRISMCVDDKQQDEKNRINEKNTETFTFATVNACLLYETLSRFNNMASPHNRAKTIGERISKCQMNQVKITDARKLKQNENNKLSVNDAALPYQELVGKDPGNNSGSSKSSKHLGSKMIKHVKFKDTPIDSNVLEEFPDLDVLFVQEAWINDYAEIIGQELHACFPYIIYDAGVYSWKSNYYLLNSGVMIASKYPILEVKFDWYKHSTSQCRLASKGLLQVKVLVGEKDGKSLVGYMYNTHLQAYQGTKPIQSNQMDNIVRWTKTFRKNTLHANDVVVFDVVGGDFNTDNMSPIDRDNWYHPLFSIYKDVCRERPGKDFHWAVGTEMRHTSLHDEQIQTPSGLKEALEDPALLQYHVLDGIVDVANYSLAWLMPELDKKGKQKLHSRAGKRRIDYLLYRNKDEHVKAIAVNPVAQLAGLTDHIPYCLTIEVKLNKLLNNDNKD